MSLVCEENFGIRHLHRQHRGHALAHVLADELQTVLLAHPLGVFRHHARQRLAEAGQMRAAVALRDVVGEAQHRLVEAVVPRQRELHPHAQRLVRGAQADRRGEHRGLAAVQPLDEGDQTAIVAQRTLDRRRVAFIAQHDGEAGVQERQLAQPPLQQREVVLGVRERGRARLVGHLGAAFAVAGTDHRERRLGVAVSESDQMFDAMPPDAHLHPFGERIHHRGTHAMQTARHLVRVLIELPAGMQPGQHHLGRGNAFLEVDVRRNAAPIVAHGDAAVAVQHQLDMRGKPRLRLVHRVVDDLERHVMQARAVIGVADIHAGAATHRIEALQDRNGRRVIGVRIRRRRGVFGHAGKRLPGCEDTQDLPRIHCSSCDQVCRPSRLSPRKRGPSAQLDPRFRGDDEKWGRTCGTCFTEYAASPWTYSRYSVSGTGVSAESICGKR